MLRELIFFLLHFCEPMADLDSLKHFVELDQLGSHVLVFLLVFEEHQVARFFAKQLQVLKLNIQLLLIFRHGPVIFAAVQLSHADYLQTISGKFDKILSLSSDFEA